MMLRTQITLEAQSHRRVRQRASELGVSLAEYMRRLVADVTLVFDLGKSSGSDIGNDKDSMITSAFRSVCKRSGRR